MTFGEAIIILLIFMVFGETVIDAIVRIIEAWKK